MAIYIIYIYMGVEPKIGGFPPQIIPFVHRGLPLFSPSILGEKPYFWKHPHEWLIFMGFHVGKYTDQFVPWMRHGNAKCSVAL